MTTPLLHIQGISKHFGNQHILHEVDLCVAPASVHGLIGPNGAGKTTLFNIITGIIAPNTGRISIDGKNLVGASPQRVAKSGIARTYQNLRLLGSMSALENVMVGRYIHTRNGLWAALTRHRRARREESNTREISMELLRYVGIEHYAQRQANSLSYGDQRRLEIARALAMEPRLLALDEPAAGMNNIEKTKLRELLSKIHNAGTTMLVIEHDIGFMLELCNCITVLDRGHKIACGTPSQIRNDPSVISAYLGRYHV